MQFTGRRPEADVSPGRWLADAVLPFGDSPAGPAVGSFLPNTFAAYARVLHPAVRYVGDEDVEVSWAEVARSNGTVVHPLAQWPGITGAWEFVHEEDQSPLWDDAPAGGHLPVALARRLVAVLRRHTADPDDCWFGVWAGVGSIVALAPVLDLGDREHWLVRGPVELATANLAPEPAEQSAHLWWPADRAWCVATDIDLMSTYVGGTAACIRDLLAAPGVEAFPAVPRDHVGWAADTVNAVAPRG